MARAQRPPRERTRKLPVALPDEARAASWLRNFRLSGFALSMLLLIVAALVVLAPNLKTFIEQRQQIAALQAAVDQTKTSVDDLEGDVARWSDPAYIESQARERLFYVFPGDVSYLVVADATGPTTSNGQPISDQIQTTQVDWVRALLSTVYEAGLTDATPAQLGGSQVESPQQGG